MTPGLPGQDPVLASAARRANRRRLIVFLVVFTTACLVGLAWNFSRPAEYRATSRLQLTPATPLAPSESPPPATNGAGRPFLTEVQALTSRPLLHEVVARLRSAGHDLAHLGTDPVLGLQATLTATPVEGTHVVELAAVGPRPQLPAALLIALSEAYREQMAREHSSSASQATVLAAEEASRLAAAVEQKRREAEAFRVLHNIVSPERDENAILGEMQGLAANLKDAQKLVAAAQGKLEALNAAAADGKGVVRSRDDPTLANLEQRASQARENLRQLLQQYTPEYLALDPQTRSLRSRVAELDEQIKAQRKVVMANALSEAESELASARSSVAQLQKQIADGRQRVGQFASRFSQYRALDTELKDLEKAYQAAQQRKARLDATASARLPAMTVLEQAALPTEPWRPLYARDAALVVGGSLLLALAAMALVELFNRSGPTPTVVLTQPTYAPTFTMHRQQSLAHASEQPDALTLDASPRLAAPASMHTPPLPRELTTDECAALLRAADNDTRRALALLLSGVAPHEAIALRWKDLDP
ncbi:MAG TPA: hypothetical protein VK439_07065, partial [Rubrivivax sp.]|nr:hypothetical protein [Rubrivivax sp.]